MKTDPEYPVKRESLVKVGGVATVGESTEDHVSRVVEHAEVEPGGTVRAC